MSLQIQENFVTDLEKFTWEKDWRALRIIKEKRTSGEFYFAQVIRYYGEVENTNDYDIGDTLAETAWLGRIEKFVGKRTWDQDHDSPTFGKRIYSPAVTETITEEKNGKPVKREVLVEGKTIYEYTIEVTKESTANFKKLAGQIALNQETQFLMIYGANPPLVVDPDTFWNTSVGDYLKQLQTIKTKDAKKE
jgi:hypothetical protein